MSLYAVILKFPDAQSAMDNIGLYQLESIVYRRKEPAIFHSFTEARNFKDWLEKEHSYRTAGEYIVCSLEEV